jgi:hypothetical protein
LVVIGSEAICETRFCSVGLTSGPMGCPVGAPACENTDERAPDGSRRVAVCPGTGCAAVACEIGPGVPSSSRGSSS